MSVKYSVTTVCKIMRALHVQNETISKIKWKKMLQTLYNDSIFQKVSWANIFITGETSREIHRKCQKKKKQKKHTHTHKKPWPVKGCCMDWMREQVAMPRCQLKREPNQRVRGALLLSLKQGGTHQSWRPIPLPFFFLIRAKHERSPHYHKLWSGDSHIWGNHRLRYKPRPGKTAFVVTLSPLPLSIPFVAFPDVLGALLSGHWCLSPPSLSSLPHIPMSLSFCSWERSLYFCFPSPVTPSGLLFLLLPDEQTWLQPHSVVSDDKEEGLQHPSDLLSAHFEGQNKKASSTVTG